MAWLRQARGSISNEAARDMAVRDLIDRENATIVGTMTRTFWEEAYRFGIDELDNEHMELCTLMAQFQKAVDDREDKEVIGSLFRKLRGKLVAHFNHEEQIFRRIDYPEEDVREHIDGHLDVLYTFDREFSKWEKDPDDTRYRGGVVPRVRVGEQRIDDRGHAGQRPHGREAFRKGVP